MRNYKHLKIALVLFLFAGCLIACGLLSGCVGSNTQSTTNSTAPDGTKITTTATDPAAVAAQAQYFSEFSTGLAQAAAIAVPLIQQAMVKTPAVVTPKTQAAAITAPIAVVNAQMSSTALKKLSQSGVSTQISAPQLAATSAAVGVANAQVGILQAAAASLPDASTATPVTGGVSGGATPPVAAAK